ncbi:MAG: hypothetical protein IMF14_08785, partial [Proteobacteria bacterium]|nr:hypothetical protein [Pseudomonadota bacterium]
MSIITFNSNSHERDVVVTNLTKFSPAIFIFFLLTACGGGGSGDQTENPIITETPATKIVQTGILLDSPISNIQFSTSSALEGKTDSSGSYKYIDGDKIVFSIGDLKFPEITAKKTITPLEIFVGTKTTSAEVINFIRLIQTMDDDGDIDHE